VREFSKVFWRTENERIFIGETEKKKQKWGIPSKRRGPRNQ
jgi:hypothetical protein